MWEQLRVNKHPDFICIRNSIEILIRLSLRPLPAGKPGTYLTIREKYLWITGKQYFVSAPLRFDGLLLMNLRIRYPIIFCDYSCQNIISHNLWYLPISSQMTVNFRSQIAQRKDFISVWEKCRTVYFSTDPSSYFFKLHVTSFWGRTHFVLLISLFGTLFFIVYLLHHYRLFGTLLSSMTLYHSAQRLISQHRIRK